MLTKIREFLQKMLTRLVRWLDPKLDKYRTHRQSKAIQSREKPENATSVAKNPASGLGAAKNASRATSVSSPVSVTAASFTPTEAELSRFAPRSTEELIDMIQRTPKSVLNKQARARIAAVMSFDDREVLDVMEPRRKMLMVSTSEMLGPLTLDKLYKSGFTCFPVIDAHEKVVGVLHTEALNALEIRQTERAEKYMDKTIYYLHANDSLKFAVEEIERTGAGYFLVLDKNERMVGFFTIKGLLEYFIQ